MDLLNAFVAGLVAGYAIAIPVGAIAILIIDASLRHGFRAGFAAGAGAATADFIYAATAAFAGAAVAGIIAPLSQPLRIGSGIVLIGLGGWGLWSLWQKSRVPASNPSAASAADVDHGILRTYQQFLALTLLNPATVIYFASLILGGAGDTLVTAGARVVFVLGAALSSLSWQSLIALFGALARRGLPPSLQLATSVLGNLIVAGLGVDILVRVLLA